MKKIVQKVAWHRQLEPQLQSDATVVFLLDC